MAWTTLSSIDQLYRNLPAVKNSNIEDAFITETIEDADEEVKDDLSKYVDWDEMEALDDVPRVVNRLAQYKTAILILVRNWRDEEDILMNDTLANSVLKYFQDAYEKLLNKIEQGDLIILDDANEEIDEDTFRRPGVGNIV
jgi:hypothetical protein